MRNKTNIELKSKLESLAFKKGKTKFKSTSNYKCDKTTFNKDGTAVFEFGEIPDMSEYIAYGEWAAKNTQFIKIEITKKELKKILK